MAIKSISQLEKFENNTPVSKFLNMSIGGDLTLLSSNILTQDDMDCTKAESWPDSVTPQNNNSYYESLLELSQPLNTGPIVNSTTFSSKKITYADLARNIIWDTKAYLNWRHALSNYCFVKIIDGDYVFHGDKTFDGNVNITKRLTANEISTLHLSARQIDALAGNITDLSAVNTTIDDLTIKKNLSLDTNLSIIKSNNPNLFLSGWAYGLKDDYDTKTTVPSTNNPNTLIGDPVWFKDGRPKALSCVNCATSAYNLINPSGSPINVGTASLVQTPYAKSKTVVKFVNGKPVECNEIDYAHHAYWSDLGEKYLADANYEPGTLVKFGGEKEITIADTEVNAIVSTKAFDLNSGLRDGTVIALCGRVPTKVKGKIQKFDKIMLSDMPGVACKWNGKDRVIGRALEGNDDENIKLVECVTKFEL